MRVRRSSQGLELSGRNEAVYGADPWGLGRVESGRIDRAFFPPLPAVIFGGAYGAPGDRLPYSSRFSGNVSIDQSFTVGVLTASVGQW